MINKPRFYYMDLNNYNGDFLIEIILWHKQEIERLERELEKEKGHKMKIIRSRIDIQERNRKKIKELKQKLKGEGK